MMMMVVMMRLRIFFVGVDDCDSDGVGEDEECKKDDFVDGDGDHVEGVVDLEEDENGAGVEHRNGGSDDDGFDVNDTNDDT